MSSPDEHWWAVRAGEYVLGTLDTKARELFERILRHDAELQRIVRDWERRLAPLDETTPAREPPARVWQAIEQRLHGDSFANDAVEGIAHVELPGRRGSIPASMPPPSPSAPPPRRGFLMPLVTAFAVAASLVMGVLLNQQQKRLDAVLRTDSVSVILGEDGAPLWLVQADFPDERVRITALRPPPLDASGDYQLWQVLPGETGVSAVALLPEADGDSRTTQVPGLADRFDAFAVSLEPDGGSPEAVPTGPVLFQGEVFYTRASESDEL